MPKPPEKFDEEGAKTGTLCVACAGQGKLVEETKTGYKSLTCKWCTNGAMSMAQFAAWKDRTPPQLEKK